MKTIAIQQPEHLPWLGFFNKMLLCDEYVFLDNVQFKKRYFENRNKIRTHQGEHWVTVPVKTKGKYEQNINEVEIMNESEWQSKYLGAIETNYKKSPYFNQYFEQLKTIVEQNFESLVDLNLALVEMTRQVLGITTPVIRASEIREYTEKGSDIILAICRDRQADVYISGPDGRNYLNLDEFAKHKIKVGYHDYQHPEYQQCHGDFVSHMSVIDLLFNCGEGSIQIVKGGIKS